MAPPASAHRTIAVNAGALLSARLRRRPPCQAEAVSIRISDHVRWQADLAVTRGRPTHRRGAAPPRRGPLALDAGQGFSTASCGTTRASPACAIWLVDSEARWVQVWRRQPDGWTGRDHIGGGSFRSAVLEEAVALDELYLNTGL